MLNTPFSPWPSFTLQEADAVRDVILSNKVNYWTGQECRLFEKSFASWVGSTHAVALANGTLALDVALLALGIGKGDEVIVTSRTFLASIEYCQCRGGPCFCRCGPGYPKHHRRDHPRRTHTPHESGHLCAPRRLALRHGSHHGLG